MEKPAKKLIISTTIIAIVCSSIATTLFLSKKYEGVVVVALIPFIFALIDICFNLHIFRIINLSMKDFSKKYMINRTLKFIINILFFLAIIFAQKTNNLKIILVYLSTFATFFVHEIVVLHVLTKRGE